MTLRIAVAAHIRHPIGPPFMGGMEAHAWHLAAGLAARGHDVSLLASGDSTPPEGVWLVPVVPEHYDRALPWHDFHGTETLNDHLDAVFARTARHLTEARYDVVHNNTLHRYLPRLAVAERLPMVTSLHVPPFGALQRSVAQAAAPWTRLTVPSLAQRAAWWPDGAPGEAVVLPNGIDPRAWPFGRRGDGSAIWLGRITPNKGTGLAVRAARCAGVPLTIYGVIEHRDYFEDEVRPHLGDGIAYGGHLSGSALAPILGRASVLLFTPLWDEPFGLAAIEAMAAGVPVAALDRGAVREVVGSCGRLAREETPEALAEAILAARDIPRAACRRRVLRRFGLSQMIAGCEALYAEVCRPIDGHVPAARFAPIELNVA